MPAEKHIFYFEHLGNPEVFRQTLAQDPAIQLTCLRYDSPPDEIQEVLDVAPGYQIRGNRSSLPQQFSGHRAFIDRCPNLLAISTGGAGYEVVDTDVCTEAGIIVVNQAGMNAEGVAEHALTLMLALIRQIPQSDKAMRRDRNWARRDFTGRNITGKTVGIFGMGAIGTKLAEFCRTFRMRVLTSHPRMSAEEAARRGAELVPFDDLLKESDFVVCATPLNKDTRGAFDARAFGLMKPTAFFVNVGRGAVHVDDDLVGALEKGEIAGAAIDVWLVEPPALDHPLLRFDNVIATPHNAGMTPENWVNTARGAAEQWITIMNGRRPPRLANPQVWPRYVERFERIMGFPVQEP